MNRVRIMQSVGAPCTQPRRILKPLNEGGSSAGLSGSPYPPCPPTHLGATQMSRWQSAVGRQILGSPVKERLKFVEEIPPNSQFQLCGSRRKLKLLFYPFFYSAFHSVLREAMNLAASRYFFSMHECAEDIDAFSAPRMKHYQLVFLFLLFIST